MTRLSPSRRGYGRDWQRLRKAFLAANPLCRYCTERGFVTAATVVDHIETIADAPHRRLDWQNLQSLCDHCHSSDKQAEDRGTQRVRIGVDGWPVE